MRALVFMVGVLLGCGSHAASEAVCVRGETRRCEGPARCAGAQACVADGTGWEACDCGEPSGAPSMDKGQRPRADGGKPAAGPDGMDAATAGDAAANDAASHTPASMDAALDAALPDAALPDAALADAGDSGEPDVPVIPDPDDDAGWPAGDVVDICGTPVELARFGTPGHEWIFDALTHAANPYVNPLGATLLQSYVGQITTARFPWLQKTSGCESGGAGACYDLIAYADQVLTRSDTDLALMSAIPYSVDSSGTGTASFAALSNQDVEAGIASIAQQIGEQRVLFAPAVMPNDRIAVQLQAMAYWKDHRARAWLLTPGWSPDSSSGFWLDDTAGERTIERGIELGLPIFFVDKGMPMSGFSPVHVQPRDIGPTAAAYPAARLIVMHAAFESGLSAGESSEPMGAGDLGWGPDVGLWPEGPYDETDPTVQAKYPLDRGVNSLIRSLREHGVGPNENVYVSLDKVWAALITRPTEAAHMLGKLLRYVGEDNVLWATESVFYGNPTPQISAFRAFQIPEPLRTQYGYPQLTAKRKAKILGLNAARLFCLQP